MTLDNRPKKTLREAVMEKIKRGQVKMHSRGFYVWQSLAFIVAVILAFILAVLAASFLVFHLRASGKIYLPGFGLAGWKILFTTFPWLILLGVVALIAILEILIQHFAYARPFVYTLGVALLAISIAGVALGESTLHPILLNQARLNRLPIAGFLYLHYGHGHSGDLHRGVITSTDPGGFTLKDENQTLYVVPQLNAQSEKLKKGDKVFVIGAQTNGQVKASNVKKVESNGFFEKVFDFDDGKP